MHQPSPDIRFDPEIERAIRNFLGKVRPSWPVFGAVLFGSRARGDFREDSDIDLAVLLDGPPGDAGAVRSAMNEAASGHNPGGIQVSPLPVWRDQWEHPEKVPTLFRLMRNMRRDGVLVEGAPEAIPFRPFSEPSATERMFELRETAKGLMAEADECLEAARMTLEAGLTNSATNRAYYAMFEAARAALHLVGASEVELRSKTHPGLRTHFHRLLLRDGSLPAELGPCLDAAEEDRLIADYGGGERVSRERAARHVAAAERFLAAVRTRFAPDLASRPEDAPPA